MSRGARAGAVLLTLALGCAEAEDEPTAELASGGLYLAVVSGLDDAPLPTTLSVTKFEDDHAPRTEILLDANEGGWVLPLPDGRSPSGRYGLYSYVHEINGSGVHPWLAGLHLVDFERAPQGPTRYLGVPATGGFAGWTEAEDLMWIVATAQGGSSLWTLPLGDDEQQPLSRIPLDVPSPSIQGCRLAPGGGWLVFAPSYNYPLLFVARLEQRAPVEVLRVLAPGDLGLTMPLWLDDAGRGLSIATGGEAPMLVAFDLSIDPIARTLDIAGEPRVATVPGEPHTRDWSAYEDADGQLWALRRRDSGVEDQDHRLAWLPLEWTETGVEAGVAVEIDLELWTNVAPVRVGERLYVLGISPIGSTEVGVFHVGLGETQPERLWGDQPWLPSTRVNAEQSLLALHGSQGIVAFELDAQGYPGTAQLASPVDWFPWGIYDSRFVQPVSGTIGAGVRVADYGASPPRIWDLPAVEPWAALPSPVDSRVFFVDEGHLWVDDPLGEHARARLWLPGEIDPEELEGTVFDPELPQIVVHDAAVHAPGVASYGRQQ